MIKFNTVLKETILRENPDTVSFDKKFYRYTTPANRCAFFIYEDVVGNKKSLFGYSDKKKEFYSDDSDVLKYIERLEDGEQIKINYGDDIDDEKRLQYHSQQNIKKLKSGNTGGGHLELENVLKGTGRMNEYADPIMKGRIFEVDKVSGKPSDNLDVKLHNLIESTIPSDKAIIVTFWDYYKNRITPYKKQYEEIIKFCGYNPEECIYEIGSKKMSYNELYDIEEPNKKTPHQSIQPDGSNDRLKYGLEADKYFKVGDSVKFQNSDIRAVVVDIDDIILKLKITDNNSGQGDGSIYSVGSELNYPFWRVDKLEQRSELEKVIDDKTQEYIEKRGKVHTLGATLTSSEKQNLENEVDALEIEVNILNDLLTSGEKFYNDNVKSVVNTSVQRKLHAKQKEKQDRYSLIAQAEKQYGMPIAQIRQKYRNVPLDQLVKKESLYKKLLKALRS
jgi:hypothetical protein